MPPFGRNDKALADKKATTTPSHSDPERSEGEEPALECTFGLRHEVKGGCCRLLKSHCEASLSVENRSQSVLCRRATWQGIADWKLIAADERWEQATVAAPSFADGDIRFPNSITQISAPCHGFRIAVYQPLYPALSYARLSKQNFPLT